MPTSVQRVISAAGMVVIAPAAGLLLLVALLFEAGAYENTEPSEEFGEIVALLAGLGLVTAVVGLYALVVGARRLTKRAAGVQAACAVVLGGVWQTTNEFGVGLLLLAALFAVIAIDAIAIWAAALEAPPGRAKSARAVRLRWTLPATSIERGRHRTASLVTMGLITATGALAVAIEYAIGGPFNLRLAGGAGLLAIGAIAALVGLALRSRSLSMGAAIVQGVTAGLLLLLWRSPRWYEVGDYDREDTVFNLFLLAVLFADAVLLWGALRPRRAVGPRPEPPGSPAEPR